MRLYEANIGAKMPLREFRSCCHRHEHHRSARETALPRRRSSMCDRGHSRCGVVRSAGRSPTKRWSHTISRRSSQAGGVLARAHDRTNVFDKARCYRSAVDINGGRTQWDMMATGGSSPPTAHRCGWTRVGLRLVAAQPRNLPCVRQI